VVNNASYDFTSHGHKRVRYTDFKRDKFNSELEAVEENSVSPDMDVRLAFEGKGRPIGSVSIFE
jgi:hypothetical protein